jgi:uncharacterized protein YheU (UPF0270 family)
MFDTHLAQQAEASAAEALIVDVDEGVFETLSSRKFTGTKIPLSAVHCRYQVAEQVFQQWSRFVDRLGNFFQFWNDFSDWRHDTTHQLTTYVTSELRRRTPNENIASWFLREGFDWGVAELKLRFDNVKLDAQTLDNEAVMEWVAAQGCVLDSDIRTVRSGLELLKSAATELSRIKS